MQVSELIQLRRFCWCHYGLFLREVFLQWLVSNNWVWYGSRSFSLSTDCRLDVVAFFENVYNLIDFWIRKIMCFKLIQNRKGIKRGFDFRFLFSWNSFRDSTCYNPFHNDFFSLGFGFFSSAKVIIFYLNCLLNMPFSFFYGIL